MKSFRKKLDLASEILFLEYCTRGLWKYSRPQFAICLLSAYMMGTYVEGCFFRCRWGLHSLKPPQKLQYQNLEDGFVNKDLEQVYVCVYVNTHIVDAMTDWFVPCVATSNRASCTRRGRERVACVIAPPALIIGYHIYNRCRKKEESIFSPSSSCPIYCRKPPECHKVQLTNKNAYI